MDNDKLLEMVQEIRETVIKMNTNMQYSQQNQVELKNQVNDIKKELEEQNRKLLDLNNKYNTNDSRLNRVEKWGNYFAMAVAGALVTAITSLIIK